MDHLDEYRQVFHKLADTRDWLITALAKLDGVKPIPSKANFVMVDVQGSKKTATECVDYLLEKGFLVRSFAKKAGLEPDTHFRISVGKQDAMEELVETLKTFIL